MAGAVFGIIRDIKFIKGKRKLGPIQTIEPSVKGNVYSPGSRAVRPWRFQGGRGVQRGLGGNPNPPSPSGPSAARNLMESIYRFFRTVSES